MYSPADDSVYSGSSACISQLCPSAELVPVSYVLSYRPNCSANACWFGVTASPNCVMSGSPLPCGRSPNCWSYVRFSLTSRNTCLIVDGSPRRTGTGTGATLLLPLFAFTEPGVQPL